MAEFLSMGGHGPYVWSAWGVTLVVMVFNAWAANRHHVRALARLRQDDSMSVARAKPTVRQL